MTVLEVGCAPGKHLTWASKRLGAQVSGIDYSDQGLQGAKRLFEALGVVGDLRCDDLFKTSFERHSFDLVYSMGVIEHFDDPRPMVAAHLRLVKPGGAALMTVPNYGGRYGRIQRHLDPRNLSIHNLNIMNTDALRRLGEAVGEGGVVVAASGRFDPWLLNFEKKVPRVVALALQVALNGAALLQPFDVKWVRPLLCLTVAQSE